MGLDLVEIVMKLEDEFHEHNPRGSPEKAKTVGDLVDMLDTHSPAERERVSQRVRRIVSEQSGIPIARISEDSRLQDDLGIN